MVPTGVPMTLCLACRSSKSYPLYRWVETPLSVLGLPRSVAEAQLMPRFVMDLRRCAFCGHVFHTEFETDQIPYRTGSNLVYNRTHFWSAYQARLAQEWIETHALRNGVVMEIGCAAGMFLQPFRNAGNRVVGYEPGPDALRAREVGVEVYQEYFEPSRLAHLRPDAIVCRHVLEHLADPLGLLEGVCQVSRLNGIAPLFLAEVPCIDKALAQQRLNDFLYEHVSNFTARSFATCFERAGFEVLDVRLRHHDEVVTVAARPKVDPATRGIREDATAFRRGVEPQVARVRAAVQARVDAGERLALWGGTGKGAAMANIFGLTADLVPVVVDSDPAKVGGFVPGTGQRIEGPAYLSSHPVDAVLICTQWKARDIEWEIRNEHGFTMPLLVYHRGELLELTPEIEL
jgi:SAM-dependent methyltransferase